MPLEYVYTFSAQNTFEGPSRYGFVSRPPESLRDEGVAREIISVTGHDQPQLSDPPSWAYSITGATTSLSRTFVAAHFGTRPPGEVTHLLIVDPKERLYLYPGPVFAIQKFAFLTKFNTANPPDSLQEQAGNQTIPLELFPPYVIDFQFTAWRRWSDDVGWCGWIVENLLAGKNIFIVYDPQQVSDENFLQLLEELYSLLPVALRWQFTFKTRVNSFDNPVLHDISGIEYDPNTTSALRLPLPQVGKEALTIVLDNLRKENCPESNWVTFARKSEYCIPNFENEPDIQDYRDIRENGSSLESENRYLEQWEDYLYELQKKLGEQTEGMLSEMRKRKKQMRGYAKKIQSELSERRSKLGDAVERIQSEIKQRNDELKRIAGEFGKRIGEYKQQYSGSIEQFQTIYGRICGAGTDLEDKSGAIRKKFDDLQRQYRTLCERHKLVRQKRVNIQKDLDRFLPTLRAYTSTRTQVGTSDDSVEAKLQDTLIRLNQFEKKGLNFRRTVQLSKGLWHSLTTLVGFTIGIFLLLIVFMVQKDFYERKLEQAKDTLTTVRNDLATAQNDLATKQKELATKQDTLTTKQKELEAKQKELATANTELTKTQNDLKTAKTELEKMKKEEKSPGDNDTRSNLSGVGSNGGLKQKNQ